ncbi:MAG TPA: leucine--tRNA ligase, partial [Bacteroidetes bacterium]|nr:leucine--tRNA ligase [Bacteroidota bacterium]
RMYEMFLGPIEQSKPWDTKGIDGINKFIKRFWSLYIDRDDNWILTEEKATNEELKILHKTIKKVTEDIANLSFNTAISAMMVFVNEAKKMNIHKSEILIPMIKLIAPFAPFISEELWHKAGKEGSVHHQKFPEYDESYLKESTVSYPISVNGKKRGIEEFSKDLSKEELEKKALELKYVKKWTEGKNVMKVIVVPGRMINIVVK